MDSKTLRFFTAFSVIIILGIVLVQVYWLSQAFSLQDTDFDQRTTAALRIVSKRMLRFNRNPNNTLIKPVERVSSNYYTVQINDVINPSVLEEFLKQEFARHDIKTNFEYAIYDCLERSVRYGGFVCVSADCDSTNSVKYQFPELPGTNYYFGVYFPDKHSYLLNQTGLWIFSSLALLVVMFFFMYALWVIFRQKRLSEIQTDFINNMTHEFKTPISTISISSEVLMNAQIIQQPERLLSYATIIKNEANRLKKHVDTVLQTAQIHKQTDSLKLETVNVHVLIEDLSDSLQVVLKEKEASLLLLLEAKECQIIADSQHLSNILRNLIDNSLKYNISGKPMIKIGTEVKRNYLCIHVVDNGIGIAEKDRQWVFNKFYRVPTGNVHDVKGFGLGLYYVKSMTEAMNGTIRLTSQPNHGSTFSLVFELAE